MHEAQCLSLLHGGFGPYLERVTAISVVSLHPPAIAGCSLPHERLVCFGDNVMGSSLEIDESIHPVIKSDFFVFLYGARSAKAVLHRFEGIYLVMDVRKLLLTQPEALRTLGLGDPCCV